MAVRVADETDEQRWRNVEHEGAPTFGDRDPVADRLRLLHGVGGQQDAAARLPQVASWVSRTDRNPPRRSQQGLSAPEPPTRARNQPRQERTFRRHRQVAQGSEDSFVVSRRTTATDICDTPSFRRSSDQ